MNVEKSMTKRLPKYCKQSPAKDPQRNLVYFMEGDALGALRDKSTMKRKAIRDLIRAVCRNYRMPPAKVYFKPLKTWTASWDEPRDLTFNTKASLSHGLLVVLHELAHLLHYHIQPKDVHEAHGPEFIACYMSILDSTRTIPIPGMQAVCDLYGIRYVDFGPKYTLAALRKAVLGSASDQTA